MSDRSRRWVGGLGSGVAFHITRQPRAIDAAGVLFAASIYHHWCRTGIRAWPISRDSAGDSGHAPSDRRGTQEKCMNWLSQIVSVTVFGLRTIPERKGSAFT